MSSMKKLTGIKEKRIIHIGTQMSDNRSIVILYHIEMNIFIKQREILILAKSFNNLNFFK